MPEWDEYMLVCKTVRESEWVLELGETIPGVQLQVNKITCLEVWFLF